MWPFYFDPHTVEEIPLANLLEQPKATRCETVSDFLTKHDIIGMMA